MESTCDLERRLGHILDKMPDDSDQDYYFTSEKLPSLTTSISSDAIAIKAHFFICNNTVAERINIYTNRRTLRLLGLLLLSKLFHPGELQLNLTTETTEVRQIVVDTTESVHGVGFTSSCCRKIMSFRYYGREHSRWPLARCDPRACPAFCLTKGELGPLSREDWLTRDRLLLTGVDTAILDLAQIFLDIGRIDGKHLEFDLETEVANGGVAPGSAALKVWLPGSDGWLDELDGILPG